MHSNEIARHARRPTRVIATTFVNKNGMVIARARGFAVWKAVSGRTVQMVLMTAPTAIIRLVSPTYRTIFPGRLTEASAHAHQQDALGDEAVRPQNPCPPDYDSVAQDILRKNQRRQ